MTDDRKRNTGGEVELLPLPVGTWARDLHGEREVFSYAEMEAYTRANVDRALAESRAEVERLADLLKDIRWRIGDTREQLMAESMIGGGRLYGCDEWSTPTVNLQLAIDKIDAALSLEPNP